MQYHLIITHDSEGELNVFLNHGDLENTREEMRRQKEDVVASYSLDQSLLALGILVSDSLDSRFDNSFGNRFEKLLTKMVRDVYNLKTSRGCGDGQRGPMKAFLHRGNWP